MCTAELKIDLFRKIDSLNKSKLEKLYGIMMNYLNGQIDVKDWDKLSIQQKNGLFNAITQLEKEKGLPHEKVMSKYRKKYSNV